MTVVPIEILSVAGLKANPSITTSTCGGIVSGVGVGVSVDVWSSPGLGTGDFAVNW
jgi:hypothetical protein